MSLPPRKLTALAFLLALAFSPASPTLSGSLDPPAGPGSTMKTLQEIFEKAEEIDVKIDDKIIPRTGQTTCWNAAGVVIGCAGTGQDGDLKKGLAWPNPRFMDHGDGTITDRLTRLVWLKKVDCFAARNWNNALAAANDLAPPQCELSDNSKAGHWRLPNIRELLSLVDYGQDTPALPEVRPFVGVASDWYWSSTSRAQDTTQALKVNMSDGNAGIGNKIFGGGTDHFVWPVRDGQ